MLMPCEFFLPVPQHEQHNNIHAAYLLAALNFQVLGGSGEPEASPLFSTFCQVRLGRQAYLAVGH